MVWMVDAKGRVTHANKEFREFAGVTLAAFRGDRWQLLVHQDDREQAAAALSAALRVHQPFSLECRL